MIRPTLFSLVAAAGLALAAPGPKNDVPKQPPLVGEWRLVRTDDTPTSRETDRIEEFRPGGVHVLRLWGGPGLESRNEHRYTVDVKADPPRLDVADDLVGIFKVEGDTLSVCFRVRTTGPRPTQFKAIDGEQRLFVYQRVMKAAK